MPRLGISLSETFAPTHIFIYFYYSRYRVIYYDEVGEKREYRSLIGVNMQQQYKHMRKPLVRNCWYRDKKKPG